MAVKEYRVKLRSKEEPVKFSHNSALLQIRIMLGW
jgi:hypothetical protein